MRKVKLPKETEISTELIKKLIDNHLVEKQRIEKVKNYYLNENDILNRRYTDANKPSNKISHNYAKYITDSYVGYIFGIPITYKSENENLIENLNNIFLYNDEHDTNTSIAQEVSICGYAYEIIYIDEDSNIRFKAVPTDNMIVVYDNTLEELIQFAIRYYDVEDILKNETTTYVEIYKKDSISYNTLKSGNLVNIEEIQHFFNDVPIVDYENNNNRTGDFENVITLINAYDKSNSDTANDFEYFTDALLVVSGVLMKEDEEEGRPLDFKNNRVLNFLDTDARAEYLIKNINDTALENYKDRLNRDIHKFTHVLDVSDENFASNISGIAMKYKLNGMENIAGIKVSKFKKGLYRRIELITNIVNIKSNSEHIFNDINMIFTRNIPSNETELVAIAKQLYGIVSEDTLLSIIPYIDDIEKEKIMIAKEKEENTLEYDNFNKESEDTKEVDLNDTN